VFDDPLTETIASFLTCIGLEVVVAELPEDTFLPGVLLRDGRILVDPGRLRHPGDLLHEAGHLAVLPPEQRRTFGDSEGTSDAGPDMRQLEIQAIAWSYAAALHLGLDPAAVFHGAGYRGHAGGLLRNFALGVYVGVDDLQRAGMTARPRDAERLGIAAYPWMRLWLRP
jgi:hypothetical protein